MRYQRIGVLGAGAWGTALALVAARAGRSVTLWSRDPARAEMLRSRRENADYLPGVPLNPAIAVTSSLDALSEAADAVLYAAPAQDLRNVLERLRPDVVTPLLLCAKGIERSSGLLVTEVAEACVPGREIAILSGPSFAQDVAHDLPTAVTIAARPDVAAALQEALSHSAFRPYASDDLVGVALGGAAKNVYAIGCGIVAGLGLGESARAGLLTRGFSELCRLGTRMGARIETLMGLSGLGDLVLTATSPHSRNYRYGFALGAGEAGEARLPLVEGVATAAALVARARQQGIELPVAETIADILGGALALDAATVRLMARPLKTE